MPEAPQSCKRPSLGQDKPAKKAKKDMNAAELKEAEGMKDFDEHRKELKQARGALKSNFSTLNAAVKEINKVAKQYSLMEKRVYDKFLAMLKKRFKAATTYKKENGYNVQLQQEFSIPHVEQDLYMKLMEAVVKAEKEVVESLKEVGHFDEEIELEADEEQAAEGSEDKDAEGSAEASDSGADGEDPRIAASESAISWCIENKVLDFNKKASALPNDTTNKKTLSRAVGEIVFSKTNMKGGSFFAGQVKNNYIKKIEMEYEGETLSFRLQLQEE